jgi:site-specific recombinase XerC
MPFQKKPTEIREVPALTPREQAKIQQYSVSNDFLDRRNHALVLLFLASGLGIEDMLSLKNTAVQVQKGIIHIKGRDIKERKIALDTALFKKAYQSWLRIHPLKNQTSFPLWVTSKGTVLRRRGLYNSVAKHLKKIGIKKASGAHRLRQTAILNACRKNTSLEKIQKQFGITSYTRAKTYGC